MKFSALFRAACENTQTKAVEATRGAAAAFLENELLWRSQINKACALRVAARELRWEFEENGLIAGADSDDEARRIVEQWRERLVRRAVDSIGNDLAEEDADEARGLAMCVKIVDRVLRDGDK